MGIKLFSKYRNSLGLIYLVSFNNLNISFIYLKCPLLCCSQLPNTFFLLFLHMYVWCVCIYVSMFAYVGAYVCEGLKLLLGIFPYCSSALLFRSRVSKSNPEPPDKASQTSSLLQGFHLSTFWGCNYRWDSLLIQHLHGC